MNPFSGRFSQQEQTGHFLFATNVLRYQYSDTDSCVLDVTTTAALSVYPRAQFRIFSAPSANSLWISDDAVVHSKVVFVRDLGSRILSLSCALPITLEITGAQTTAYSYDLDELAIGHDEASAIDDMRASLVALYFLLKGEQGRLGPLQQRHWDFMRGVVKEETGVTSE